MSVFLSASGVPPPPAPPTNGAQALVAQGWSNAQGYATTAFDTAKNFLTQIATTSGQIAAIPPVNVTLTPVANAIQAYVSPPLPVQPAGMALSLPATPADPTLVAITPFDVGQAPTFTAVALPLALPTAPGALTTSVPLAPTLTDVLTPASPTIILPDVPTLLGVNIPAVPMLNMPAFSALLAVAPTAPANTFGFAEATYTSTLLTSLRTQLQTWVTGAATGISPAVEQAIWDRGRAREVVASARKVQEAFRNFAQRGFSKPAGSLAVEVQEAIQEAQNNDVTASREVMVKQADLEQTNRRFAFEQAFKVESELITYQNNIATRAFETAKYTQQVALDLFVASVQRYTADVQAYGTQAQVFKTLIDAELSKLEVYKTTLEGQKLIGELNVQSVDIYKARITAAMSLVEIFKAQIEAANLTLQGNKVRIDGFAAQVTAYDSTVKAKASEYQGFATMVQAEVAKIELFKGQAEAYSSQVNGFKAAVEAAVAEKNIEIEVNQKVPLDVFKARTEIFRVGVEAEASRVGALTKVYEANAQVFGATVQGETARVGAQVNVFKAQSDVAVSEGQLRIEAAKANIQTLIQQVTLLVESVKAGAQVSAQLAASALSAVNLSGQIGDHVSYSASISSSNALSTQFNQQVGDMTYHNLST